MATKSDVFSDTTASVWAKLVTSVTVGAPTMTGLLQVRVGQLYQRLTPKG